jgi:large subunit ribosomal protein L25
MAEVLNVQQRHERGTKRARRLRGSGGVPAVLYGHGEENICLTVARSEVEAVLRHRSHLVELRGFVNENALIREVQWDTFGAEVLHIDLTRVYAGESVTTTVAVELRGDAPGSHDGGLVQQLLHEVDIQCPASEIPERLSLNINTLTLGGTLTAADLPLPEGAKLVTDPTALVTHCVAPAVEVAEVEEEVPAEAEEPELIGRRGPEEGEPSE